MTKKKTTRQKEKSGGAKKEDLGVHVISKQDIEDHFGAPEIKKGDESSSQPAAATGSQIADVRLQLDAAVWQEAKTEAARLGLEVSKYVELALDRFRHDPAK